MTALRNAARYYRDNELGELVLLAASPFILFGTFYLPLKLVALAAGM